MASARKTISSHDYLLQLELQIDDLRTEARRLNRRLRDARTAVRVWEEGLTALAASIQMRLAETDGTGPSTRPR